MVGALMANALGASSDKSTVRREDDEDDEGTMVSLLDMASQLDIQAMESVLKMDKRYKVFAHVPEQRTAWVRAYLQSLSVPKRAVRLRNE